MKVGEFVIYEDMGLAFGIGEIKWIDEPPDRVLVQCERTKLSGYDDLRVLLTMVVLANGARAQITQLHKRLCRMALTRKLRIKEAEDQVTTLAGSLAGEIRKEIKAFEYGE
jgi:hypothetical protein